MVTFSQTSIYKCQFWAVVFFLFASISKSAIINPDFLVRIKRQALNAKLSDSSTPNHIENSRFFFITESTTVTPLSNLISDSTLLPDSTYNPSAKSMTSFTAKSFDNLPQINDKITQTNAPYGSHSFNRLPSESDLHSSTQVDPLIPSTTSGNVQLRSTDTSDITRFNSGKGLENLSTANEFLQSSPLLNSLSVNFNTLSRNSNISFVSNTNIPKVTNSTLGPDYIVSSQSQTMHSNLSSHFFENKTSYDNIESNTPREFTSKTGSYLHVTPTLAEDFIASTSRQIVVSDDSFFSSNPNAAKLIDSVSTDLFTSSKYKRFHVSEDTASRFYTSQHVTPSSVEDRAQDHLTSPNTSYSSTVNNSEEIFNVDTSAVGNTDDSFTSGSTVFGKTNTDESIILSSTSPSPTSVIHEEISLSSSSTHLPQSSKHKLSSSLSESRFSSSRQIFASSFKSLISSLTDLSSTRPSQIANLSDTTSYKTLNSEITDSSAVPKTSSPLLALLQSTELDAASSYTASNQKSSHQRNNFQTTVENSHFTKNSSYASSKDFLQLTTLFFKTSKEQITISPHHLNLSDTTPHQATFPRPTHIGTISILRGHYFTYSLSKSLFRPYINMNDFLVNLSLYAKIGSNKTEILPKSYWIRINSEERLIYGVALSETLKQSEFVVLARSSKGDQARVFFQVRLNSYSGTNTSVVIPHTFTFKLDFNYGRFIMDSDNLIRLLTITSRFLSLDLKRNVVVNSVRPGSVLIEWSLFKSSSLPICLRKIVFEKFRLLVELNNETFPNDFGLISGRPSGNFSFSLHPYFNISNITLRTFGPCILAQETSTFSHVYTTARRRSNMQPDNSLSWIIIPFAIVILLSLAFGIICASLYQKRKHTSRLTFDAIKSVYGANRKPILLLDEMVLDNRQQSSRPRGPLVLANEAYLMSELHVNSLRHGAVMYPEGAFKSKVFGEGPPDYRLPPPYIASPAPSSSNV